MALNPNNPRGPYRKKSPALRFWSKTIVQGNCIVWTGSKDRRGYGWFGVSTPRRELVRAHRWIAEQIHGPQPPHVEVRHACDNPACVKLQHLEIGSHRANMQECIARGRFGIGRRVPSTMKLSDEDVAEIKQQCANGANQHELARRFGVRPQTINGIARGKSRR